MIDQIMCMKFTPAVAFILFNAEISTLDIFGKLLSGKLNIVLLG